MMVADGGLEYGHHLGPEKYCGGRSRMVVRIGGKAGTERARQGRFCDAAGGRPDPDRRAEEMGGVWQSGARSTRPTGAIFRTLARVDPSVALVATMHPTVLALWLEEPVEPPVDRTPGASSVTAC